MKKLIISVAVFVTFGLSVVCATPPEPNVVQRFSNTIAYGIYKAAWPTARYSDVEVENYGEKSNGDYYLELKLSGNGRVCFIGKCPLWSKLLITTDTGFNIKNMRVLKHNAKMVE
ncbi:hypothetical protein CVFO_0717 [Isorropodon fossajaponicum endosymbiont JTNG4]|uniref:hypothetical protein n=1 Tax=Isorropodon fossajaponicum symbiont TaxID=883811 RepID=UPI001915502F|nr:hypothetical protein [Isorropodon fossajaponicum symbiont]BBB23937.1 hypothetical protein CVFO_0717 [Isorropodon fossajaponicum endosymbiont JTNG4]